MTGNETKRVLMSFIMCFGQTLQVTKLFKEINFRRETNYYKETESVGIVFSCRGCGK